MNEVELVVPAERYLPGYVAALKRGWSPSNIRGAAVAAEEIAAIENDPALFIAQRADDREARGAPVTMPDGSTVERLPGFVRWIWDGEFCGSIGLRWPKGMGALPSYVLGHIGYAVVPWKQGRGYATRALRLMLAEARDEGLPFVELTTDPDNIASQKVILANNGVLIERFREPAEHGGARDMLRYRILLADR